MTAFGLHLSGDSWIRGHERKSPCLTEYRITNLGYGIWQDYSPRYNFTILGIHPSDSRLLTQAVVQYCTAPHRTLPYLETPCQAVKYRPDSRCGSSA